MRGKSLRKTYKGTQIEIFRKCLTLSLVVLKNRTRKEYTGIRSGGSKAA